jgi:quinol monooxygenase YgiN
MRTITIWYDYAGPEEEWRRVVGDFIAGINGDPEIAGKFTYQVTTADDSRTRVHWGRWDNQETLQTMQSRNYFKRFSEGLKELIGGQPNTMAADVVLRTSGW